MTVASFHRPSTLLLALTVASATMTGCGSGGSTSLPQTGTSAAASTSGIPARSVAFAAQRIRPSANGLTSYASTVLADAPAVFYQMDDTTTTMLDLGPNAVSGTYGADVTTHATAITAGAAGAALFPGGAAYDAKGYAYTPRSVVMEPASTVTLEAWVKLNAHNTTNHDIPIVVYGTVGKGIRYGLYQHGLGVGDCFEYQQRDLTIAPLNVCSNTRPALNTVYHVVVVSNGSTVSMFFNGVPDKSVPYAGSIDYTTTFTDGLQIGGANQVVPYASASFPGSIAGVSIYNSALTQSQIAAHFLAGQIVPFVTETPANSDAFVDSIGINAHFDNQYGIYGTQYATVKSLLFSSGIRHMREAMVFNSPTYLTKMQELAAGGVHGSYLTQLAFSQSQISAWPAMVGTSVEAFEAPNEQDDVSNPNWLPQCIAFEKTLYSWVKGDPNLARYSVLGPAIVNNADVVPVGDLSAYMDNGNIHDYMSVFNPGTTGWGGYYPPYGWYGSIAYNVNLGRVISGSKPMIATETGYGTIAGNPLTLDYRAHLRYMTRLFFEQFNGGITRSYMYEFMDEGGTGIFSNFGLVQTDLQPKPAYNGLKSLISALADPGAPFAPTPLTYNITGFNNNVAHTLLQRRNGQYQLAIWIEAPAWVTANNAGGDIIVPPQTITLSTSKAFSTTSITTMDDNGIMTTASLPMTNNSATFQVTDKVSIVNLKP